MNDMSIYDKFSGPFNGSLTGQSAAVTADHGLLGGLCVVATPHGQTF